MCLNPWYKKLHETGILRYDYVKLPCGKCVECRSARANDWRKRLMLENDCSLSSFFVTLTYDNDHLPSDGVRLDHLQKFFKRLRNVAPTFRYYACGEYGDLFGRPHYHFVIFFREAVDTFEFGNLCNRCWSSGNVVVGTVTPASISYVTKYIVKGFGQDYGPFNKPFQVMSRRPALGSDFIDDRKKDYYNDSSSELVYLHHGNTYYLPRYFKKKMLTEERKKEIFHEYQLNTDWETFPKHLEDFEFERFQKQQKERLKSKRK